MINHAYYEARDVPVAQMSLAQWESTLRTNLTSSFLVAREYLRGLDRAEEGKKEKAAIVLIGSTAGKFGEAGHADYAATKSGEWVARGARAAKARPDADWMSLSLRSDDVWTVPQLEERDREDRAEGAGQRYRTRYARRGALRACRTDGGLLQVG